MEVRSKMNKVAKKRKGRSRSKFRNQCVQYVKMRSGGYIHPQDTTWDGLAYAFEHLLGLSHVAENHYERCIQLAHNFRIKLPKDVVRPVQCCNDRARFYSSLAWKKLRYATLVKYEAICQCCGVGSDEAPIRVDHIKPISKYWHLRLDPKNVQVLCNDCNWGKLNIDETDWR